MLLQFYAVPYLCYAIYAMLMLIQLCNTMLCYATFCAIMRCWVCNALLCCHAGFCYACNYAILCNHAMLCSAYAMRCYDLCNYAMLSMQCLTLLSCGILLCVQLCDILQSCDAMQSYGAMRCHFCYAYAMHADFTMLGNYAMQCSAVQCLQFMRCYANCAILCEVMQVMQCYAMLCNYSAMRGFAVSVMPCSALQSDNAMLCYFYDAMQFLLC